MSLTRHSWHKHEAAAREKARPHSFLLPKKVLLELWRAPVVYAILCPWRESSPWLGKRGSREDEVPKPKRRKSMQESTVILKTLLARGNVGCVAQAPKPKLNACDVLNWEYLVQVSAEYNPDVVNPTILDALAKLAYELTQSGDEAIRNQQFSEFLHRLTDNTSTDSTETALKLAAARLHCDLKMVRQFAKENGIKLKKFRLL